MSKMSLMGNTGRTTKQDPAACFAFCLETEDSAAKYLHRLFAQHGQRERGWRCASAQPIRSRGIRRRDLDRLCFGDGEEKTRKAKPSFRAGVCEPVPFLVLLQEGGQSPLNCCGKETTWWHFFGWMLCRLWRGIGSSLAEDTAFIPYFCKIRIQLYKNVFQDP